MYVDSIHTYINTYIHEYIHTYIYIHLNKQTFIHTHAYSYINNKILKKYVKPNQKDTHRYIQPNHSYKRPKNYQKTTVKKIHIIFLLKYEAAQPLNRVRSRKKNVESEGKKSLS